MEDICLSLEPNSLNLLAKTRYCKHVKRGCCVLGERCGYAHEASELQQRPNLRKTRLCVKYLAGLCEFESGYCRYAHGRHELRSSAQRDMDVHPRSQGQLLQSATGYCAEGHADGSITCKFNEGIDAYDQRCAQVQYQPDHCLGGRAVACNPEMLSRTGHALQSPGDHQDELQDHRLLRPPITNEQIDAYEQRLPQRYVHEQPIFSDSAPSSHDVFRRQDHFLQSQGDRSPTREDSRMLMSSTPKDGSDMYSQSTMDSLGWSTERPAVSSSKAVYVRGIRHSDDVTLINQPRDLQQPSRKHLQCQADKEQHHQQLQGLNLQQQLQQYPPPRLVEQEMFGAAVFDGLADQGKVPVYSL